MSVTFRPNYVCGQWDCKKGSDCNVGLSGCRHRNSVMGRIQQLVCRQPLLRSTGVLHVQNVARLHGTPAAQRCVLHRTADVQRPDTISVHLCF